MTMYNVIGYFSGSTFSMIPVRFFKRSKDAIIKEAKEQAKEMRAKEFILSFNDSKTLGVWKKKGDRYYKVQ